MEEAASSSVNQVNKSNETVLVNNNNASNAVSSPFQVEIFLIRINDDSSYEKNVRISVDTGKLTENAANKVNSMLNKNVEEKVKEDVDVDEGTRRVSKSNRGENSK